jgi:hypothetical protein
MLLLLTTRSMGLALGSGFFREYSAVFTKKSGEQLRLLHPVVT